MSEISDAVQIIRVTYEGIEIAMKVGSGSIELMQKAVDLIVGMLNYEKTMGKTNLNGMLKKGGDIQVVSFADEELKKFQPSLEVGQAEDAIYQNDLRDVMDIVEDMLAEMKQGNVNLRRRQEV